MDGAKLQTKVYAGYDKAAKRIGFVANHYRPASASDPLGNLIGTLYASYNAMDMSYGKPNKYGVATYYGLFDGRVTQAGDYLQNTQNGTFFIASQEPTLPIYVVKCNATVTVLRPQQQSGVGALGYGGNTDANETALMTGWPCSILQGTKGEKNATNLPGDVKDAWWLILLPHYDSVKLRSGDIIKDDLARRFVISSAELTDLGWRLTAAQAQT